MSKYLSIGLLALTLLFSASCNKDHCTDGENNKDELGVDCGGFDCEPCVSCNDGKQNQDETGVDCGGTCEPCDLPWSKVNEGGKDLTAVDFSGATGYAVGKGGVILKSSDFGSTWTALSSGTTEDLNEVHVYSETQFSAVGNNDVVLVSTDGSTVNLYNTGYSETWKDVHFTSTTEGLICGSKMRILRTTDAGKNWTQIFSKPTSANSFETMYFLTEKEGYAFGGLEFRQTLDGGKSWSSISGYRKTPTFKDYRDVYYKTVEDAYCITEDGMFLLIPDAFTDINGDGEFWVNKSQDVSGGKIDFYRNSGLYAGKNNSKSEGKVLISFDGGVRWKKQSLNSNVFYSDGEILTEDIMVVVGTNSTIYRRDK
ncbi:MAG: WD40/YVTN/BNR-like repeat-containing protein [Salibacteraceae bacterium]